MEVPPPPPPPRLVPLPNDLMPIDSRPKYALHALHNHVETFCAQKLGSAHPSLPVTCTGYGPVLQLTLCTLRCIGYCCFSAEVLVTFGMY